MPRSTSAPAPQLFKYKPQYGVVVLCADEPDQTTTYNRLNAMGLKLKVVSV